LARKWDALERELELRVVARAGAVQASDPRFRLLGPGRSLRGPVFYAWLAAAVAAETRRFRPQVVICQSPYEAFACLAAWGRAERPRLIVELHADWRTATRLYGSRLRRAFARMSDRAARFALRRADATRALSEFTARLAREATGRPPAASFPAYIDLESFTATPPRPPPSAPAVAWIGVLERCKDPRAIAEAWRIVAAEVPDARLVVVGRGPLRAVVDRLAREFPTRVRAASRLESREVARLLDESTLLAMSSADGAEGLPRVIMEALTRGRPVVCTGVGGVSDIVTDGRNGLVVPPGHPRELARAMVRVLSDRGLAARLASGAREHAERAAWTPGAYAVAVRQLVDRVIAAR
jgi:glycosyltransferase involved in cell wall biosynthesis